jgi:hypothetical protein
MHSLTELLTGKTIKTVEFIDRDRQSPNLIISETDSQALVIHFADGTSLAVGSHMNQATAYLFFKISDKT